MKSPRTARQAELLAYIAGYIQTAGTSPSYGQMAERMGLVSRSGVFRMIEELEDDGFLRRETAFGRRTIIVISRVPDAADLARLTNTDLRILRDRVEHEMCAVRGMGVGQ